MAIHLLGQLGNRARHLPFDGSEPVTCSRVPGAPSSDAAKAAD